MVKGESNDAESEFAEELGARSMEDKDKDKDEDHLEEIEGPGEGDVSRRLIYGGGDAEAAGAAVSRSRRFRRRCAEYGGKGVAVGRTVNSCCALAALALILMGIVGLVMLPRNSPRYEADMPKGENRAAVPAPRENILQWSRYHDKLKAKAREEGATTRILLLGDSITEELLETSRGKSRPGFGSIAVWEEYYKDFGALNLGMGGDQTQHLLWRLQNGELPDVLQPESILVAIGTNNLGSGMNAQDTVGGIKAVVKYVHQQRPDALVCVMALFPRAKPKDRMSNEPWSMVNEVNTRLEHLLRLGFSDGNVRFLDCNDRFLTTDETGRDVLDDRRIMRDKVHLTTDGLRAWAECVADDLRSGLSG